MPEFIRDFVDTSDMLGGLWGFFSWMSTINPDIIVNVINDHLPQTGARKRNSVHYCCNTA